MLETTYAVSGVLVGVGLVVSMGSLVCAGVGPERGAPAAQMGGLWPRRRCSSLPGVGCSTVDRRFSRRRHDAARMIDMFNLRLRDQIDLETLHRAARGP